MTDNPMDTGKSDPWAVIVKKTDARGKIADIAHRYRMLRFYAQGQREEFEQIRSVKDGTLVELRHIEKWAGEREDELITVLTSLDAELKRLTDALEESEI